MTDKTNDLARNHRRTGLLREMSDRQLDVKELLSHVRSVEDKTVVEGLAGNLGHSDDQIIAVVLARIEMSNEPNREVENIDLVWAGEFLDHLDTQGFVVTHKELRIGERHRYELAPNSVGRCKHCGDHWLADQHYSLREIDRLEEAEMGLA